VEVLRMRPADFNTEIERARSIRIEDEIKRRAIPLKRQGAELIGGCPVCGGRDRFGANIRKQVFNCRGCEVGGNVIALVQHIDGCDFVAAVKTLNGGGAIGTPTSLPQTSRRPTRKDDQDNSPKAAWIWLQREPITEGTPPWLYLRKRGHTGPIPPTLGYLPARGAYSAAMIAAFGIADEPEPGIIVPPKIVKGIHLTRITGDGEKALNASGKAKIMAGLCKGAPITVSPPSDLLGMAVTEGIEDGLSVYQSTGLGVWAAGCGGFMPALEPLIPEYIEAVTIYAHDDETGRGGAIDLARSLKARGIEVFVQGL
jgi:putative DNA primase/helicase